MAQINDDQFMQIAKIIAQSSKCVSMSVGALIVNDNRIISHGYNGTPPGATNCRDLFTCRCPEHTAWSLNHEVHAEMNAIIWAAKRGTAIEGSTVYCTHEPCPNCLKHLLASGVEKCIFEEVYYNEQPVDKSLKLEMVREHSSRWSFLLQLRDGNVIPYEQVLYELSAQ